MTQPSDLSPMIHGQTVQFVRPSTRRLAGAWTGYRDLFGTPPRIYVRGLWMDVHGDPVVFEDYVPVTSVNPGILAVRYEDKILWVQHPTTGGYWDAELRAPGTPGDPDVAPE